MKLKGAPKLVSAAVVATMCLSSVAFAQVEGPKVFWKLSMWGNPRALSAGMEEMAKNVSEETDGKFEIKIFYGAQLSSNRENLDGIKLNAFEGGPVPL
tara:strand:- start:11 stop:304 length:294 start_codon:yes stop_codon:yes gene_type:complete